MLKALIAAAAVLAATPAAAEVVERHGTGFTLRYQRTVEATPDQIVSAMTHVGDWWDSAHTYSGDAANITVDMRPSGCWCERMADGRDFRHATVVDITDGGLAFDAPFGPLNGRTTRSDLFVTWPDQSGGRTVTWTLFVEGGLGIDTTYADVVDGVIGAGFDRFARYLEN